MCMYISSRGKSNRSHRKAKQNEQPGQQVLVGEREARETGPGPMACAAVSSS